MSKKTDPDKYAAGLLGRTGQYAERVRLLFSRAVDDLLVVASSITLQEGETFMFKNYPAASSKATAILRTLYSNVYAEVQNGVRVEWGYANKACDALVTSIFGKGVADNTLFARWFSRNNEAMDAFFARKSTDGGLNLSQRVWKYIGQFKAEIETALDVSLGEGMPASRVAAQVRQYLQEPDRLFRRVRDKHGNLVPSKAAKAYHPGQGIYRSSHKNAMRLARSEPNLAYRTADFERWQSLDFVVGVDVKLSRSHPKTDICDDLAGRYPKAFKFPGWHVQCFCFATPVLATPEEMITLQEQILAGDDPSGFTSRNAVNTLPSNFKKWVRDNADRQKTASTIPYFIRDNYVQGDLSKGLIRPL